MGDQVKLYVDLPGFYNPSELFVSDRPDIALIVNGIVYVLELTCCHELNLAASKNYKREKYKNLTLVSNINHNIKVFTIEVSSIGFVQSRGLLALCKDIKIELSDTAIQKLGEMSLRCSFFIFCNRHKPWPANITDPVF